MSDGRRPIAMQLCAFLADGFFMPDRVFLVLLIYQFSHGWFFPTQMHILIQYLIGWRVLGNCPSRPGSRPDIQMTHFSQRLQPLGVTNLHSSPEWHNVLGSKLWVLFRPLCIKGGPGRWLTVQRVVPLVPRTHFRRKPHHSHVTCPRRR